MKMNQTDQTKVEFAAFIGLDWADQSHLVCARAAGSKTVEPSEVKHDPKALAAWVSSLQQRFGGRPIAIALEQSRGALVHALMGYDFLVLFPVNPKTLAKYREALRPAGAKDDPGDAELLLELVVMHRDRLRAWVPDDEQTRMLALLVEYRRDLVKAQTRLSNRLKSLLKGYYPQALGWAGKLTTTQACDFLERWPTLADVQRAGVDELREFYAVHRCRRDELIAQRVAEISLAQPLTRDLAVITASLMMVKATVTQLRVVSEAVDRFQRQIEELFLQHPDHDLFQSFPGAGAALAPRLLTAIGTDRERFTAACEMQQFSGIAPVTKRSGQSCLVHWRWACPKFVRQSFHEFAAQSIHWSGWAKAFYTQQRQRGKGHHAAVRSLAF